MMLLSLLCTIMASTLTLNLQNYNSPLLFRPIAKSYPCHLLGIHSHLEAKDSKLRFDY